MNTPLWLQKEQRFLRDQIDQVDHKIKRTQNALTTCSDQLETNGLTVMLHAQESEKDTLRALLEIQDKTDTALTLDALIMDHIASEERALMHLRHGWHRHHALPTSYWEAEMRRSHLVHLLNAYHAWEQHRALYNEPNTGRSNGFKPIPRPIAGPAADGGWHQFPWYVQPPETGIPATGEPAPNGGEAHVDIPNQAALDALQDAIYQALDAAGGPQGYLTVIVESPEMVIVRGYAHTPEERAGMVAAVLRVPSVQQALFDVQLLGPEQEPPRLFPRPSHS